MNVASNTMEGKLIVTISDSYISIASFTETSGLLAIYGVVQEPL